MKNKTMALWLTLLLGPLGLHRVYLTGRFDQWSVAFLTPTLIGAYGVVRARALGMDDGWSWVLIPFLGFAAAACALLAIVYGLQHTEKWNHRFNPGKPADDPAGVSNWLTIAGLAIALFAGTTVLLASIAFTFQRYFEFEQDPSQALDAPTLKKPAN
jgi:hypothetical protein